jgi:hypothetical protein
MGGGGGGSWSFSEKDLGRIKEQVEGRIQEAREGVKRNVFISFASENLQEVNLLRGQAQNENSSLEFNDWSLKEPFDSANADYIRRGIRERIRQSSVTVVFVSESTANSAWVDWEIRESRDLGKKVVAMYSGDRPPSRLPRALVELRIRPIPWTQAGLQAAIN